jgi:nucleotide-binding universal stress UspA family protein
MPGVILVVLDDPRAAPGLLAAASCLAALIGGAVVDAQIIRLPPRATISSEEILTRRREDEIRGREQERAATLAAAFRDWCSADGTGRLSDVEAIAADVVAEHGARADFVVIGRPGRHGYGTSWQAIHAALFETDRPVLVVPPDVTAGFGRRIAIAWRDDNRTVRAVLAVMHCLGHLETLFVLAGRRDGAAAPRMPDVLVEHGISGELVVTPVVGHRFGDALLGRAHALGADMIAMGAFARDPVRRLMLGGLTRYMLANADLPVLMRH